MRFFHWLALFLIAFSGSATASIIKKPPTKTEIVPYKDLVCTELDRKLIGEIISTIAENGGLSLLLRHQSILREKGAQIEHVHPLKFLATILKDPYLKYCLSQILADNGLKWSHFISNLSAGLSRESEKGTLMNYLKDFAADIGVSPDRLHSYFENRDWGNMVISLLEPEWN